MTERALWVAKTGLDAQQTRMAVISNNLANVNTTGFKKDRAVFQDLMYQNMRQVGAQTSQTSQLPTGMQLGTGVKTMAIEQTGNQMDIAVNGRGFLQVSMPDGSTTYTRDGQLKLDLNGQIVNANGLPLTPTMTIPQDALSITIGTDGTVSILQPNNPTPSNVGQIQTANFINLAGLEPIGENLYRESGASGPPIVGTPGQGEFGAIVQNSLETSNVNVVEELVGMIETQRAYEMNSKAISTTDQMLSYATQNL
jgi:flagellar basal-body rod protein FlgG